MISTTYRLKIYCLLNFALSLNKIVFQREVQKYKFLVGLNPQIPSSHPDNKSCWVSFVFDSLLVPKREVGLVSGMSEWNTKHWTPRHNSYLSSSSFNDHHHCYPQLLALMMIIPFPVWAAGRGTLSMWVNDYWAPTIFDIKNAVWDGCRSVSYKWTDWISPGGVK